MRAGDRHGVGQSARGAKNIEATTARTSGGNPPLETRSSFPPDHRAAGEDRGHSAEPLRRRSDAHQRSRFKRGVWRDAPLAFTSTPRRSAPVVDSALSPLPESLPSAAHGETKSGRSGRTSKPKNERAEMRECRRRRRLKPSLTGVAVAGSRQYAFPHIRAGGSRERQSPHRSEAHRHGACRTRSGRRPREERSNGGATDPRAALKRSVWSPAPRSLQLPEKIA